MADHLGADLSVEALARRMATGPRNFARVFARSAGITPARYVEKLRIEGARRRLEESRSTVDEVVAQMRLRHTGVDAPLVPADPARESHRLPQPFRE